MVWSKFELQKFVAPIAVMMVLGGAIAMASIRPADPRTSLASLSPATTSAGAPLPTPSSGGAAPDQTPTATPAVAGAATVAPAPAPASFATPNRPASAAPAPTPVPAKTATLNLKYGGKSYSYQVALTTTADACSILTLARQQGIISSVTFKDYPALHSLYVSELNGIAESWTFTATGPSGNKLNSLGCSLTGALEPGATVSWNSYK